ncbi:MAG TPA: lipase maturation factor family protein, partial [Chthoniobacteraceae bacterium]|nr:lipase maturation factor family protein [Chthoniobacteraceae bacterium]
ARAQPHIGYLIASGVVALLIACLSVEPVMNLFSPNQQMNNSFDPFDLVNTYGAFGSVGKVRNEIIFEGTTDDLITAHTVWKEYEFPYKPGNPMRRPPIITPYYGRLDWQIWFAAMATPDQYPWTLHFVWKLLHNDAGTLSLLANNPFPGKPPHYIRARLYRYEFAPPGEKAWWRRQVIGEWMPALGVDDLKDMVHSEPWLEE